MKKHCAKTYADAHNHFGGILSVDAIKVMLSSVKIQWDSYGTFEIIPNVLLPNATVLSFSDNSMTNDNGWLDCLDVLSRIVVFTALDIKSRKNNYNSKPYQNTVNDMLFLNSGNKQGSGRGMNSAGLLLAGCITMRCLLDSLKLKKNCQKSINNYNFTDSYFKYLQSLGENPIDMGQLFIASCFTDNSLTINKENWLFNKIRLENLNPQLQAYVEQISVACITSALATSLWAPFDDNYAIRGLLRRGETNKINYYMLTLRWLLEKEAIHGNYFSEISINLGELKETYEIIKANAVAFGFKEVTTGGIDCKQFLPLIIENDNKTLGITHNNKLYLRFLTGALNTATVRWDVNIDKVIERDRNYLSEDKAFGCWAGVDLFGIENFVYTHST